ncbi:hypothetical protein Salat_2001500 [Sesamum alatum]|uniref:Uncharacterized protein n=1 Tax=Sesamum alatum TaxID=300844 RepID=A0AAE1XZL6_9LAMI|nr:hypothetical protein Salat_2001500 [Sesamum alatum]
MCTSRGPTTVSGQSITHVIISKPRPSRRHVIGDQSKISCALHQSEEAAYPAGPTSPLVPATSDTWRPPAPFTPTPYAVVYSHTTNPSPVKIISPQGIFSCHSHFPPLKFPFCPW